MKHLDLNKSVYDLCKENPDLVNVLSKIGFEDISKPGMLHTAGRFMTIPKGAKMKKIDMAVIEEELKKQGYKL